MAKQKKQNTGKLLYTGGSMDKIDFLFFGLMVLVVGVIVLSAQVIKLNEKDLVCEQPIIPACPELNYSMMNDFCPDITMAPDYIQYSHRNFNIKTEKYELLPVMGMSMQPSIVSGNTIIITNINPYDKLESGDIVCFEMGGLVCHRIEAIYPTEILLRGDYYSGKSVVKRSDVKYLVRGVLFT
jgi:hypothetical protein